MADYYVRSSATGSGTGADWTNAFTTLAAAMSGKAAGSRFFVANDHAESSASNIAITSPGTASNPCLVICVNTNTTIPPTGVAETASISSSGGATITITGFVYIYGIIFLTGSGTSLTTLSLLTGTNAGGIIVENCKLKLNNSTSTSSRISIGSDANTSNKDSYVKLINTTVRFGATGQGIIIKNVDFSWENTASAIETASATVPTTLFLPAGGTNSTITLSGVDLSALTSGKNIVSVVNTTTLGTYNFVNCKLASGVTPVLGTVAGQGGLKVSLINCGFTSANYNFSFYKFGGSIVREGTIVKSGGGTDPSSSFSDKIVTLSSGPSSNFPFESRKYAIWNTTVGSSVTLTIDLLHDSTTNLTNADVYAKVYYLPSADNPDSAVVSSGLANVLSSPSDLTTSSETWTTTELTNPNKQKIVLTCTPQMVGFIYIQLCIAKPNYTIYVDSPVLS